MIFSLLLDDTPDMTPLTKESFTRHYDIHERCMAYESEWNGEETVKSASAGATFSSQTWAVFELYDRMRTELAFWTAD